MSGRFYLILGLLIYLAAGLFFSLKTALPKKEEIQVPKIEVVKRDTFKDPVVAQVKAFGQFGQLPVTIDKSQQGKDNPFSD